jgi:DNA (cytosine-5)-methyltransferase 1
MSRPKLRVVSLFSGAMGLDIGLHQTGRFKILAAIEKDHACCETIRANQANGNLPKSLKVIEGDIAALDPVRLLKELGLKPGELDVLIGGPPCQSFSTAGRRRTVQDPRGSMLWEYLRFVAVMKPKFFLLENVRGILSAAVKHRPIAQRPERGGPPLSEEEEPGSVVRLFAKDISRLAGDKYHMDCFEVNAVNYGAPQLRERAVFIGNRLGKIVDLPDPTHGGPDSGLPPWATLGDALKGIRDRHPVLMDFSPRKKAFLARVPPGGNWRSLPLAVQAESMGKAFLAKGGRSGWWRRLSLDLPCPTLVTMPNHASTSLCHPKEVRVLSVREYARVQGFPDAWRFKGTPAEQYSQVGNAVPIRLGEIAGSVIAKALASVTAKALRNVASLNGYRVVYIQSHVRTRKWFSEGQAVSGQVNRAYAAPKTLRKSRVIVEELALVSFRSKQFPETGNRLPLTANPQSTTEPGCAPHGSP